MSKIKEQFASRKFKGGAYASVISVIVIAVILVINLVVGEFGITKDVTVDGKYSILDSTRTYLKGIRDDIKIYYLCEDDYEFQYYDLELFFKDFNSANKKVQIVAKDPVKYPKFAEKYTDEEVNQYSFIVVDETNGRSKYVDVYDYILTEFNYNTYSYDLVGIDVEGQLVSAIGYVINEDVPRMYLLSGHGESEVSDTLASGIARENVETENLTLITEGEIPEDCDILMIYNPMYDLDEQEKELIEEYAAQGGNVLVICGIHTSDLPNMCSLLNDFGIELTEGYVLEGDSKHYMMRTPYQLVPTLKSHSITSELVDTKYVICPICAGMRKSDDISDTLTVHPLIITTDEAYSKIDINAQTYAFEDGDVKGPFYIGLEVIDNSQDAAGRMIVYSTEFFLDDSLIGQGTYANGDIFYNTLNYMADIDTSVSIRSVSLAEEYITVNAGVGKIMGFIYMFLLPGIVLAAGIVVAVRRRRL